MHALWWLLGIMLVLAVPAAAQLDRDKIVADYRVADLKTNEGRGYSESKDSGTLGWGEAGFLRSYSDLWLATGDTAWLGKIREHFDRVIASASDPDGDGFLGWQTTTYSAGFYQARALHNVSAATIEPAEFLEMKNELAAKITGHNYLLEVIAAGKLRVFDQTDHKVLAAELAHADGKPVTAIPGCKVTIKGATSPGDVFMVRTVAPEPTEFAVHEGMLAYPVAIFIEAVMKDPKLQPEFGAAAQKYLEFITRNFLLKHEQHWLDRGEGSGAWRFMPLITDRYPNRIMPHNQFLASARAFLVLQDLPGADPLLKTRTAQMAQYFRRHLHEQDAAYVWHYWDWIEGGAPGNSGWEDTSHGAIDISFAVEAARRGVVFTAADMQRFARTYLDLMWNGDAQNPLLGPSCATKGDKFSAATHDWVLLCEWEPKIYDLALTAYRKNPSATRGPMMLVAEQRRGK